jgi:SAM-dependent methyltransferase
VSDSFDRYADSYVDDVQRSIAFARTEHDYFTRRKAGTLVELAARHVGAPGSLRVLDVGCGIGATDRHLAAAFAQLYGVDVSGEAVERALQLNPSVRYDAYDGKRIPHGDASMDLAFATCVLHHVEPGSRPGFAAELARVARPGGLVVVFEHNPLNPLTRRAVRGCEFDRGVVLSGRRTTRRLLEGAGLTAVEARYIIFTTSTRERVIGAERRLGRVPLGAQYYVAATPR